MQYLARARAGLDLHDGKGIESDRGAIRTVNNCNNDIFHDIGVTRKHAVGQRAGQGPRRHMAQIGA